MGDNPTVHVADTNRIVTVMPIGPHLYLAIDLNIPTWMTIKHNQGQSIVVPKGRKMLAFGAVAGPQNFEEPLIVF